MDWVEAQVFSDGLIQDRGWFDVRVDFSDHVNGEVRIESKDPLDIIIDPDAKHYDPRTWNEIFETKWMSLDEIEEAWIHPREFYMTDEEKFGEALKDIEQEMEDRKEYFNSFW